MNMNPQKIASILKSTPKIAYITLLCFLAWNVSAPLNVKSLAVKFFDRLKGSYSDRCSGYWGFLKWPNYFGHTRQEIYELIGRETDNHYNIMAFNIKTKARGLTQVRKIALEDIAPPPDGKSFFKYKVVGGKRYKLLNKRAVYRPYYNIYAGAAYYRLCKRRAKAQKIGDYEFTREQMAKLYYVAGIGTWNNSFKPTLRYIQ